MSEAGPSQPTQGIDFEHEKRRKGRECCNKILCAHCMHAVCVCASTQLHATPSPPLPPDPSVYIVWLTLHSAPARMSSGSLSAWLQSLSLSEYEEVLHQQGFTALHQLRGITQERLREIGIVKLGHVKRILKNIPLAMNGDEVTPPITTSGELVSSGEKQPQPIKTHVDEGGGEEEMAEAPPPAVPRRRRQSSSSLSDSDCHNEGLAVGSPKRNLSPPPMIPLCEDSQSNEARRPPVVPRRQQSLINMRRGSCEAEDAQASSRDSSRDRQSQRMSLPPDSITSIPGLDRVKSPPPVPLRKSSLTPSPEPTVIPPEVPEQHLLPVSREDSPAKSEPSSDHEIEVNASAVEPYVDQRLLADGPPSFSPPPPPTSQEEEESKEEVKPPSAVPPSYVNVDLLLQVGSYSPTPLPRRTISQKQPVAAPRRKKPSAPSAQPSELHPTDPTSNMQENLSPPEYSVVQRQGLKRADAMQDEYVYTSNTAQPAACPQQPTKEVTAEEYEDMDSPAQPAYETVKSPPPRSGNTPTHLNDVSSSSQATPPLPVGITSAYSEVEMTRNSAYSDVSHTGRTPPENFPTARGRSNTRPLVCIQIGS